MRGIRVAVGGVECAVDAENGTLLWLYWALWGQLLHEAVGYAPNRKDECGLQLVNRVTEWRNMHTTYATHARNTGSS